MRPNKNKAKESKQKASEVKTESRMDQLLREIDNVISKKKCSDKSGNVKK